MKCARSTIRVAQRVDFRGPPSTRATDRLSMLPPFPLAERCALIEVESIDKVTPSLPQRASAFKDCLPMSALGPAIETIIDRRVRTIIGRAIAPACTALKHMNDTADNASIIIARRAGLVRWQMRLYLSPLLVVEPEQSFTHRSRPRRINSAQGNQSSLIRYRP
jgi:hypothetical protein